MTDVDSEDKARQRLARVQQVLGEGVPHNRMLGLDFYEFGDGQAASKLAYRPELVGNPATGVLHGGVVTAALDATCGGAVFAKIFKGRNARIATIDLRIDYLKPAAPERDLHCRAECYKLTKSVAFVRGHAFVVVDGTEDIVAHATGGFMVFERETPAKPSKAEGESA